MNEPFNTRELSMDDISVDVDRKLSVETIESVRLAFSGYKGGNVTDRNSDDLSMTPVPDRLETRASRRAQTVETLFNFMQKAKKADESISADSDAPEATSNEIPSMVS